MTLSGIIGAALGIILWFFVPPTFESKATFIPVSGRQAGARLGFANVSGLAAELLPEIGGVNSAALAYPDIMTSRSVLESVLERRTESKTGGSDSVTIFQMLRIRNAKPNLRRYLAVRKLRRITSVRIDRRTSMVTVVVNATTPKLATDIANGLVEGLEFYNLYSRASLAHVNRKFIESRIAETKEALVTAESRLADFRQRNLRIGNSPELLLIQGRLARDVRIQEEVFLTLMKEYEIAKIEEQKDTPFISVVDAAVPSPVRSGPGPARAGAGGLVAGFIIGSLLALTRSRNRSTVGLGQ